MPIMEPTGHNKPIESSPYWSGRYLIYDMKHIINRTDDVYTMLLKCLKDNVPKAYIDEHNSWTHYSGGRKTTNIYEADNELLSRVQSNPYETEGTPFQDDKMRTTERIFENRKFFGVANARRVWQPLQQAVVEIKTGQSQ